MKPRRKYFLRRLWVIYRRKKMIARESFGGDLFLDIVSETGEGLDEFMVIWKMAGRNYSQIKNKQDLVARLDGVAAICKLVGSRSSRVITGSRLKPSEVVQLLYLLKMFGCLARRCWKREAESRILKSQQKSFWMREGDFFAYTRKSIWMELA